MDINRSSPLKISYLITELSIGGAQTALFRLLRHLDRTQFQPTAITLFHGIGAVAQQIRALDMPVTDLGMSAKWRLDALGRLFVLLRQQKPDILHSWMFHANVPARIIGRLASVPVIISSERTMGQESQLRHRLNRWTAPLADRILCVSEQVQRYAQEEIGLPAHKLITIPNGIELSQFAQLPSQAAARAQLDLPMDGFIVGAIGRPRPVKGYHFLLQAWAKWHPAPSNRLLLFVGDGPDRPALQAQATRLGVADSVQFWGDRSDVLQIMPALNLLVSSSLHEGMSNVILEAMAAGLPVIATAVGGTPELVLHEQTGLLLPSADPLAMSHALAQLWSNPSQAQQLGKNGQQRIWQQFDLQKTVQQTETVYRQLWQEKCRHSQQPN